MWDDLLAPSREQVTLLRDGVGLQRSHQVKQFPPASLPRILFEHRPQRLLACVCPERLNLGFQPIANFDDSRDRSQGDGLPSREDEVRGGAIQLLYLVRNDGAVELVRE